MESNNDKVYFSFYIITLTFLISFNSQAKLNNIRIEEVPVESGLSPNATELIFQDTKGFLWIGTQDGLFRYDGYKFKKYKTDLDDTF